MHRITFRLAEGVTPPVIGMCINVPVDDGRDYIDFGTFVAGELNDDGTIDMTLAVDPAIVDVTHERPPFP